MKLENLIPGLDVCQSSPSHPGLGGPGWTLPIVTVEVPGLSFGGPSVGHP